MGRYNNYKDTHFLPLKRTLRRFCITLTNAILRECPTRTYNKLNVKLSVVCVSYEEFLREYLLEFHQENSDGDDGQRWSNLWEGTLLIIKSAENKYKISDNALMFMTNVQQTVTECCEKLCTVRAQYEISQLVLTKFNKFVKRMNVAMETIRDTFETHTLH